MSLILSLSESLNLRHARHDRNHHHNCRYQGPAPVTSSHKCRGMAIALRLVLMQLRTGLFRVARGVGLLLELKHGLGSGPGVPYTGTSMFLVCRVGVWEPGLRLTLQ